MTINKNRRSFMQGSVIAGAAAVVPLGHSTVAQAAADKLQKMEFPLPDFAALEGDEVRIKKSDNTVVTAVIEEVSDIENQSRQHQRPAYLRDNTKVVRFNLSGAESFDNEIYQVSHEKLGKLDLLLSVVPDAKGRLGLEAIFN